MYKPLKGFIAFSHENTTAKIELKKRLSVSVMVREGMIRTWDDGEITPGGKAR